MSHDLHPSANTNKNFTAQVDLPPFFVLDELIWRTKKKLVKAEEDTQGVPRKLNSLRGRRICFPWVRVTGRTRRPPKLGDTSCRYSVRWVADGCRPLLTR